MISLLLAVISCPHNACMTAGFVLHGRVRGRVRHFPWRQNAVRCPQVGPTPFILPCMKFRCKNSLKPGSREPGKLKGSVSSELCAPTSTVLEGERTEDNYYSLYKSRAPLTRSRYITRSPKFDISYSDHDFFLFLSLYSPFRRFNFFFFPSISLDVIIPSSWKCGPFQTRTGVGSPPKPWSVKETLPGQCRTLLHYPSLVRRSLHRESRHS